MAAQTAPIPIAMLPPCGMSFAQNASSAGSNQVLSFAATGAKIAWVFQAASSTIPDQVDFHINTVTTAGSAGTIEASIQTLDSSGNPSGTIVASSATGSLTPISDAGTTGYKNISGMSGSASLTAGTMYALVLAAADSGGTWNRSITMTIGLGSAPGLGNPYGVYWTGSAWAKLPANAAGYPVGFRDSGGARMQMRGFVGAASGGSTTQLFTDSTNPDERGNRFSLPFPATLIGVCVGVNHAGGSGGSADDFSISVYSSHTATPNQLETTACAGGAVGNTMSHMIYFDTAVNLSANTVYAIAYKARGTDNAALYRWDYNANADLACMLGTDFYSTTRDGGAGTPANPGNNFTDDSAKVYALFPIFSAFDDGAGGGGGGLLTHPGMGGGMRG